MYYSIIPIHWDMKNMTRVSVIVNITIIGHGKASAFALLEQKPQLGNTPLPQVQQNLRGYGGDSLG